MSDKRSEQKINEVLQSYISKNVKLDLGLLENQIKSFWHENYSGLISRNTKSIRLYKGVLTVQLNSAPLKQELVLVREKILKKINDHLGGNHLKELRII